MEPEKRKAEKQRLPDLSPFRCPRRVFFRSTNRLNFGCFFVYSVSFRPSYLKDNRQTVISQTDGCYLSSWPLRKGVYDGYQVSKSNNNQSQDRQDRQRLTRVSSKGCGPLMLYERLARRHLAHRVETGERVATAKPHCFLSCLLFSFESWGVSLGVETSPAVEWETWV